MLNYKNNFIKWFGLKAFKISNVSNVKKLPIFFGFLYKICFLHGYFYYKCNLKNPQLFSIKQEGTSSCERFSLKIANKSCYERLKYCKFTKERKKTKHVNINTKILWCFNSSTKYRKTFGFSVERWSQLSKLVCFDWLQN